MQRFMNLVYAPDPVSARKMRFLYRQSGIDYRYSTIPDYSREVNEWKFYPHSENLEPFPLLEQRMTWYHKHAPALSVDAIRQCLQGQLKSEELTHLITVSCTGMSAPGLDLQVVELLDLPLTIARSSVNFMGCYAAIHALKMADDICNANPEAKVMIVCTELCTLHFQKEATPDQITSSMLFGDGSAAALVTGNGFGKSGWKLDGFYSEVIPRGKRDMSWELSSTGFLMTLSGYIPELIEEDFDALCSRALERKSLKKEDIAHWCIHPGGKRILEAIQKTMGLEENQLGASYEVLRQYGNMSSPTILFVLKTLMTENTGRLFGAAFGPGLTMETFIATPYA